MRFEKVSKYKDDEGVIIPFRATKYSAGYDLFAAETVVIQPNSNPVLVPTGVKVYLDPEFYLSISARSSLPYKQNLIVANAPGIVDSDYCDNPSNEGHIFVQIKNLDTCSRTIEKGSKIAQGVVLKYYTLDEGEIVNERIGGFGSTGV